MRNNVLTAMDATWRMADGLRSYGEILIDDLHARSGKNPNKFAFQFGAEGAWPLGPGRFLWGGEFTRVTRYVYTSFFGRDHALGGQSLGFPTGPDARRLRLRGAWDVNPDWGISVIGTRTNKGENDIDEPFLPALRASTRRCSRAWSRPRRRSSWGCGGGRRAASTSRCRAGTAGWTPRGTCGAPRSACRSPTSSSS